MDQNLIWGIIELTVGFLMLGVIVYNIIQKKK